MDSLYLLLKFVHVAAIIVWVGGIFTLAVINARLGRTGDAAAQVEMGRQSEYFGRVAIGPAMIVALIAGLATAVSIGFPLSSLWIIWGLIGFVASGVLVAAIGRTARELGEVSQRGAQTDSRMEALRGRLLTLNAVNLLLLGSVVWAMVFKPAL